MRIRLVPVMCGEHCLELAGPARVARLVKAPNATAIRRRRDGLVVEIQIEAHGNDDKRRFRHGNPLSYSSNRETESNPANVWRLKRIPTDARPIFRAVLDGVIRRNDDGIG